MKLLKGKVQLLVTIIFVAFLVWWGSFQHVVTAQGIGVQWFSSTYGVVALIGALIGFRTARKWGGFQTVLGKALIFFSLGLLAQEVGQLIYAYYIYAAKIQIPYPSWGDVAYFGSVLLYITAAVYLARAAGAKFSLHQRRYRVIAVVVPVVLLAISYWVFLHHHVFDTTKPLKVFLDFGYPMGQAIYVSIALTAYLLSRKLLGGVMRPAILLITLALFVQYISDFTFVYQSSRGTYLSGKDDDLLYLISYFVMASALLKFYGTYQRLRAGVAGPPTAQPKTPMTSEPT